MEYCAILIPCYNEEKTIRKVVRDWKKEIPEATIYVYDNNSTDNTAKIAKEEGAVVRREYKQGKGNVIRRMFREIDAQCYIMIDGDDTYPVEYGRQMMQEVLEKKTDMVVGDRLSSTYFEENKRPFHNFGNSLVRFSINHLIYNFISYIFSNPATKIRKSLLTPHTSFQSTRYNSALQPPVSISACWSVRHVPC